MQYYNPHYTCEQNSFLAVSSWLFYLLWRGSVTNTDILRIYWPLRPCFARWCPRKWAVLKSAVILPFFQFTNYTNHFWQIWCITGNVRRASETGLRRSLWSWGILLEWANQSGYHRSLLLRKLASGEGRWTWHVSEGRTSNFLLAPF